MANITDAFTVDVLSLDDITLLASGSADPSITVGYDAPMGSLFLRTNGSLYRKTGLALVDWTEVVSGGGVSGLALTTIGGQEILTVVDTTRGNKILSSATMEFDFDKGQIKTNSWMSVASATDANNGHAIPLNATIVGIAGQAATGGGRTINLYVDNVLSTTTLATFPNNSDSRILDMTLNVDLTAGQKIQLRGGSTGSNTGKASVILFIKWRG